MAEQSRGSSTAATLAPEVGCAAIVMAWGAGYPAAGNVMGQACASRAMLRCASRPLRARSIAARAASQLRPYRGSLGPLCACMRAGVTSVQRPSSLRSPGWWGRRRSRLAGDAQAGPMACELARARDRTQTSLSPRHSNPCAQAHTHTNPQDVTPTCTKSAAFTKSAISSLRMYTLGCSPSSSEGMFRLTRRQVGDTRRAHIRRRGRSGPHPQPGLEIGVPGSAWIAVGRWADCVARPGTTRPCA